MMYDFDKMTDELLYDEGFRRSAYQDHLGYWTIGIGRLIDKRRGGGITEEEAKYLLGSDLVRIENSLDRLIPWWSKASDVRQRALVNMAFQLGINGLMKFKNTLAKAENGDWDGAAKGALRSRWARQTPARAKRIAKMLKDG